MTTPQTPATTNNNTALSGALAANAAAAAKVAAKTAPPTTEKDNDDEEGKKTRTSKKIFIVTGTVHEFKNAAEAEKFLNSDEAEGLASNFTVIKGLSVPKTHKVSLR